MNIQTLAREFIVKRVFRRGLVTRPDVVKVLGVSSATATRYMALVGGRGGLYQGLVHYSRAGIRPRLLVEPPGFAGEAALLKDLAPGYNNPLHTGLFDHELPVTSVSWVQSLPARPGVLTKIIQAIRQGRLLKIVYVGLRAGSAAESRRILPLGLERMNDQWRVIAQDISKEGAPIRVFVLPRILDVETDPGRKPRHFVSQGHTDSQTTLHVLLNPRFTPIQQQVMRRELRIERGTVSVATRSLHEFKRRFTEAPPAPDVVWPPLILKED